MPFPFTLARDTSPKLRVLQACQLSIAGLTIIATFLAAVIPSKHKGFTFGILYSLIFTSCTTAFLVYKEQTRAAQGSLTKDKYVKYQLFKMVAAVGCSILGFIASAATPKGPSDPKRPGQSGLWIDGIKVNKWQGMIMWMIFFNWVFLWAGLFYSCCMTGNRQGAIALGGEEAQIGLDAENENDEAIARRLQAQDPNWQS
ncbi:hypothetical protein T440DRAFT_501579 [Plenodomus tracheiphilus IPT5]|uniref:Uncharacterized protein n=1 Tax=Plenodomus tracheiphilus IPT5 TaxID=1408161 RepID=A0A6A7AUD7_9PLEO|nr:hypothetical protein T440DRAFT_501579 [Plenodomus tracheiphilus IPT5]